MTTKEKRKRSRRNQLGPTPVFIEINHSYGPIKKSVYKVRELNEFGLSFCVPVSDGYFLPATPLSFSLIKEKATRSEHHGTIRYYYRYDDESGNSFYIIGVEIHAFFSDMPQENYKLRPKRYSTNNYQEKQLVQCKVDGKTCEFLLADISKYSAAFFCSSPQLVSLRISSVLSDLKIIIGEDIIYDGSAVITQTYHDKNGKNRVVIEPRKVIFNIGAIEKHDALGVIKNQANRVTEKHSAYSDIDIGFKAAVADLRCFLEEYRELLEAPQILGQTDDDSSTKIRQELFEPFFEAMDKRVINIDTIVNTLSLSEDKHSLYKSYYQKHLHHLLLSSPINHRSYFKPVGYAGDYEIMRMNHENEFKGPTLFAKLLSKYTTSTHAGRVGRKRTEYLARKIVEFVSQSVKEKIEVFSIASGPSLEIDYLLKSHPEISNRISLTLLDQEIKALQFSQDTLYEDRIKFGTEIKIQFIHQTVGDYLQQGAIPKKTAKKYDLIYAFGLFDYFDHDVARFVIKFLLTLVKPEGRLLIANTSLDGYQYRSFLEYSLEWYLVYRDKKEMLELAKGVSGAKDIRVSEIENGTMKFLEIVC